MSQTFGSCFAGVGGFDLGFERAGMECLWQVEIDRQCRKLLAAKFPHTWIHPDIRTADKAKLARVDVICGGFPCQDLSVAGRQAGLRGSRSGLFYPFIRLINELRPSFVLWENVPGLLTSDQGRDFARVLLSLGRIGYSGAWRLLDAQYLGVAQRRRRIFGMFARNDIGAGPCAEILSLAEGMRGHPAPSREAGKGVAGAISGGAHPGSYNGQDAYEHKLIANTLRPPSKGTPWRGDGSDNFVANAVTCKWAKGTGGGAGDECQNLVAFSGRERGDDGLVGTLDTIKPHLIAYRTSGNCGAWETGNRVDALTTGTDRTNQLIGDSATVRRITPTESERLQGFPDGWTDGFSDSVRYRMLGNAVAVPCAEWIGRRIARCAR